MSKRWNRPSWKQFFEFDGNFYTYTGKIFDMILVSIYWLVGCIPVLTIGASFAALHSAVTKSIRQDRETITVQFWKSYKENLRPSLAVTLIFEGTLFLLLLNIGILREKMPGLFGLFLTMLYGLAGLIVITCACYGFPVLSRFDMPTGWIIKVSGYLTFKHLPISLILLAMAAGSYFAIFARPFLVLILPGLCASVASPMLEQLMEPLKQDSSVSVQKNTKKR